MERSTNKSSSETQPSSRKINESQKGIIQETVNHLPEGTNINRLIRKLNSNKPMRDEDPQKYIVEIFRDTSKYRLKELGDNSITDKDLRLEMVKQLNKKFATQNNPEPFASTNIKIDPPGYHVRSYISRRDMDSDVVRNF